MILDGLTITVVGMAVVFAFLVVLVLAMILLFIFLKRFMPKSLTASEGSDSSALPGPAGTARQGELAVIAAAITATKAFILKKYRG